MVSVITIPSIELKVELDSRDSVSAVELVVEVTSTPHPYHGIIVTAEVVETTPATLLVEFKIIIEELEAKIGPISRPVLLDTKVAEAGTLEELSDVKANDAKSAVEDEVEPNELKVASVVDAVPMVLLLATKDKYVDE